MSGARLRYLGYQVALAIPSAICAVAAAQSVPDYRPYTRLASTVVVVILWLFASSRLKRWFFGGRLLRRLRDGHFDEVAELYAPAFELARNPAARLRMALLLSVCDLERGREAEALTWLDQADLGPLVDETTQAIVLSQRARALADQPEQALPLAEKALELSREGPHEVAALTARGVVHLRAGHGDEAVADLERAAELATEAGSEVPYLAATRARLLGDAYAATGNAKKAHEAWARAAAFPPHIPSAREAARLLEQEAA